MASTADTADTAEAIEDPTLARIRALSPHQMRSALCFLAGFAPEGVDHALAFLVRMEKLDADYG